MKGVPIDNALREYLKQYRRGQENAASSKELEGTFHTSGRELRRAVNRLRCDGHPISDTGYFYAARQSEIRAAVAQLTGCIFESAVAAKGRCNFIRKRRDKVWQKSWTPSWSLQRGQPMKFPPTAKIIWRS